MAVGLSGALAALARRRRRSRATVITDLVAAELAWLDGPPLLASIGGTGQCRAVVRNAEHQVLSALSASYASGTPATATVNASTGLVTAVANGTSVITASYSGLTSITQTATVSQQVASIAGVASTLTTDDASSGTFSPVGKDANNNTVAGATFAYSSDAPSVCSVNASTGAWAGQSAGTAHLTITASPGGATFVVTATVTHALPPAPTLTGVSPSTVTQGQSVGNFVLTGTNIDANVEPAFTNPGFTWTGETRTSTTLTLTGFAVSASAPTGVGSVKLHSTTSGDSSSVSLTVNAVGAAPTIGAQGQGIMGAVATAVPISYDAARLYDGSGYASPDQQWHRTKFGRPPGGAGTDPAWCTDATLDGATSTGSEQYPYGSGGAIDKANIVASSTMVGAIPAFRFVWTPVVGASPASAQFMHYLAAGVRDIWIGRRIKHLQQGEIAGAWKWDISGSECTNPTNITYNSTGGGAGKGFKHGPFTADSPGGDPSRAGVAGIANAALDGSGNPYGQYQLDNYFNNGAYGFTDQSSTDTRSVDTMLYDGKTYDEVIHCRIYTDGNGNDWVYTKFWHRLVNADFSTGPWYRIGAYITDDMYDGTVWHNGLTYNRFQWTSKNHNAAIEQPRYREISETACYDGSNPNSDGSDDPWGCAAADAATTPPALNTVAFVDAVNQVATFNITRTASTGVATCCTRIRAVINGVDQASGSDYVIPDTISDITQFSVPLTLTQGSYNIQFKAVSADGAHASTAFPATPIAVTITAQPDTPTVANASSASTRALRIPFTVAATGGVPSLVMWQYSTDSGVTWTAGPDVSLYGTITLGQALHVALGPLPTVSTAYTLRVAAKNSGGYSAWSSNVTGSTVAATTLTALPSLSQIVAERWHSQNGVDVATGNSAGIWCGAINGYVLTQNVDANRGSYVANLLNSKPGLQFTGAQFMASNRPLPNMNVQNQTIYVVASITGGSGTRYILAYYDSAAKTGWHMHVNSSGNFEATYFTGSGSVSLGGSAIDAVAHELEFLLNQGTPTKESFRKDGVQMNGDAGGFAQNVTQPLVVGSNTGAGTSTLGAATLKVHEIIPLTGPASSSDDTAMHSYCQTEWTTA